MPFPVACPSCRVPFPVSDRVFTSGLRCSRCGRLYIPEPPHSQSLDDLPEVLPAELPDVIPVLKTANDGSPFRQWPSRQRDREKVDGKTSPLAERAGLWVLKKILQKVLVLLVFMPCGGCALLIMQWHEGVLFGGGGSEPQVLSCEELLAHGPGENRHILLTDFRLDVKNLVAERGWLEEKTTWKKAWVPTFAAGDSRRQRVWLFVEMDQITKLEDLQRLQDFGKVQGMLHRNAQLPFGGPSIIEKAYPDTYLRQCWVLRQGRTPVRNQLLFAGGVGLIIVGLFIWAFLVWLLWPERKQK